MKSPLLYLAVFCCIIFFSCKKDKENNPLGDTYPVALSKVFTPTIMDSLIRRGVPVYSGLTPPVINGIYYLSPNYCSYDNSWTKSAGKYFIPYKLQFSNQNGTSIAYAYKGSTSTAIDAGSDVKAFITGRDSVFTVYAQIFGAVDSVSTYTNLVVISGVIKNGIISNLKQAQYILSKNDRFNRIVPVGTMRVYVDGDKTTGNLSTFSINEQHNQQFKLPLQLSFAGK
jgi:hypothetical protein